MCRERVSQCMDTSFLFNARFMFGLLYYFLNTSGAVLSSKEPLLWLEFLKIFPEQDEKFLGFAQRYFIFVHRVCRYHSSPAPKAREIIISIIAIVTCKNRSVTFFKSLLPMYTPTIADKVAQTTKVKLSVRPALVNLVA